MSLSHIHIYQRYGKTVYDRLDFGYVVYRDGKVDMVLFPGGYATINGTAVTFHYYTQDYLGNNRAVINGSTGAIEQTVAYYPYGAVIADLGTNPTKQQYKFGGKELITANGLNEYDFGARNYYPAVPAFTRIDPLCEDTKHLSPYLYCGNNPANAFDPDGRSTWVTDLGDGRYKVIGGDINDKDRRIYVYKNGNPTVRGKAIGITATLYSFYDTDANDGKGAWMQNSIIDSNDMSGDSFLHNLVNDNPPLFNDYMKNAQNGGCYDFKSTNGGPERIEGIDHYRGMPIGETGDGLPIFASARDVGNIAAGYIAAANGLSWKQARKGFDGYQSIVSGRPTIEGLTTRSAEAYGYRIGYNNTSPFQQGVNLRHSINEGIRTIWNRLRSILNGF
ncbi:MAG: hypothetical protein K2H72_00115 [Muribaculaceae bacterium]|nr:hypothetical protein [Muribaculaceae bacterium]